MLEHESRLNGRRRQPFRNLLEGRALVFLLVLSILYTIYFAGVLLLPIFLAALIASLLHPLVRSLNRLKIPDGVGAMFVLGALLAVFTTGIYGLSDPAAEWISRAPSLIREMQYKLHPLRDSIKQAKEATEKIEEMTEIEEEDANKKPEVEIKKKTLAELLVSNTRLFVVDAAITIVLIYFILARGRRTFESVASAFEDKENGRKFTDTLSQIQREITRYLGTITLINLGLAIVSAFTLFLLDFPNPILWGLVSGGLNFIPYVGPLITTITFAVISYSTFDSWPHILLPPLLFLFYTTMEGNFITPWILGKRLLLNPIMIFITILFLSWAWGMLGVILAVPILAALKVVSGNVKSMNVLHAIL